MALRKEHLVLIVTAAGLGWLGWSALRAPVVKGTTKRAEAPELAAHAAPDVALVLPEKRDLEKIGARELFSPPSDTRPLPPLEFEPPPLTPLAALRPPPAPAPGPALYGKFLRVEPAQFDVPGLFAVAPEAETEPAASAPKAAKELTAQERLERVNAWKKLYDWYRTSDYRFGRIANEDRYRWDKRPNEPLLFVEFNPETGVPRLPGQPPVSVAHNVVTEFGFAGTIQNEIEVARVGFGDPLPASQYDQALYFANQCIEWRHETPRALEVAEELFTRAGNALKDDAAPRLGLARCYEAGFQLEKAFQEYQRMLSGAWSTNARVAARLAELEARVRLHERAEARLRDAERRGRTDYVVQSALGRFLLARGAADEAVEHLRLANQYEPAHPDAKRERAELRCDLAAALVTTGALQEAADWYEKARQADPTEARVQAGLAAIAVLRGDAASGAASASGATNTGENAAQGFELLLANGLAALADRTPAGAQRARDALLAAADADPVRAVYAWRALAYLAETTNNPEDAQRFIDLAIENDPTDAWTLFERGRLLAAHDDLDGANTSFKAALDQELDFPDALAQIGELNHRRGDFAAADKYLERATLLDPKLAIAFALRGVNFIEMGDLRSAEDTLKQALAIDPAHPTARNALAWVWYRKGGEENAIEAQTRLRELDDSRRALPETDVHRAWANAQIKRISDHLEKVVWSDRFDRKELRNNWDRAEQNGPQVSIHDGIVTLAGPFKSGGRARLWQTKGAGAFVALEARITVHSTTTSRVGLFVSRETQRAGDTQVEAEVVIARANDPGKNGIQWRAMKRGEEEAPYTDVAGFDWPFDQPVLVRIERAGEAADARIRVLFDGFPVVDNKAFPSLGRTNGNLFLGVFAEGQPGRTVNIDVDDVEITYREKAK